MIALLAVAVVLGSARFAPHGDRFGTAHSRRIFNGGGNHPAQRVACTRAGANFTAWLARSRTWRSVREPVWAGARLEEDRGRRAGRGVPARARARPRGE